MRSLSLIKCKRFVIERKETYLVFIPLTPTHAKKGIAVGVQSKITANWQSTSRFLSVAYRKAHSSAWNTNMSAITEQASTGRSTL